MAILKSIQDIFNAVFVNNSSSLSAVPSSSSQDILNVVLNSAGDALRVNLTNFTENTVATTDATTTVIETISTSTDEISSLVIDVIGVKDDGAVIYHCRRIYSYKNDGGSLSEVSYTTLHLDNSAGWVGLSLSTDGTDIKVNVKGAAATNVRWQSQTMINQVVYSA